MGLPHIGEPRQIFKICPHAGDHCDQSDKSQCTTRIQGRNKCKWSPWDIFTIGYDELFLAGSNWNRTFLVMVGGAGFEFSPAFEQALCGSYQRKRRKMEQILELLQCSRFWNLQPVLEFDTSAQPKPQLSSFPAQMQLQRCIKVGGWCCAFRRRSSYWAPIERVSVHEPKWTSIHPSIE